MMTSPNSWAVSLQECCPNRDGMRLSQLPVETSIMCEKTALNRTKIVLLAFVICITFASLAADADTDPCPCVPLSYMWMASPCETWNCAASALVLANGDPYTVVLPMTSDKFKWVVLRRVVSGSAVVSPDAPVIVERYNTMVDGSARFSALDHEVAPLLTTAVDGNVLVVFLRQAEKGSKGHAVSH